MKRQRLVGVSWSIPRWLRATPAGGAMNIRMSCPFDGRNFDEHYTGPLNVSRYGLVAPESNRGIDWVRSSAWDSGRFAGR